MDFIDYIKAGLISFAVSFVIYFALYGICVVGFGDIPEEITYIQNDINIDAIKYKNEIYLKKGE